MEGFIDLEVICSPSGQMMSSYDYISIPICQIRILSQNEELNVEKMFVQSAKIKYNIAFEELNNLYNKHMELEKKYLKDTNSQLNLNQLAFEETKEILIHFDQEINESYYRKNLDKEDYVEVN
jgi:hypothetical protein